MKIAKTISNTIKSITDKKATIKALECVLIDATQKELTATDLDIMAVVSGIPITGNGKMLVNGYALQKIVATTKKTLEMSVTDKGLKVISDGDEYTVDSGLSPDNFPVMTASPEITTTLKNVPLVIFNTVCASSTEETRYYLKGVFLETEGGIFRTVATDGHRLAMREMAVTMTGKALTMDDSVIVPRKTVHALQTIFAGQIDINIAGSKAIFATGNVTIISKLIDLRFPDYRRVIPSGHDVTIDIDGKELARILGKKGVVEVKGVEMFGGATGYWVRLDGDKSMLEKKMSEVPSKIFKIRFNASYMEDIIADMANKSFKAHISETHSPIKIESSDEGSMYVLMPIRV